MNNLYQNQESINILNKYFINRDLTKEYYIEPYNKNIKISEMLQNLLYFYFINEVVFMKIKKENQDFQNYLKINESKLIAKFFDFLDKFVLNNLLELEKEFEEYKIFEGYEEIISLLIFYIKQEDLDFDQKNKRLVLTPELNKKIKVITKKINKFSSKF